MTPGMNDAFSFLTVVVVPLDFSISHSVYRNILSRRFLRFLVSEVEWSDSVL